MTCVVEYSYAEMPASTSATASRVVLLNFICFLITPVARVL